MARFNTNQWIGIILIICALLLFIRIPFITISSDLVAIVVLVLGVWNLFR